MSPAKLSPLFTWRGAICESDLAPTTRHVGLTLSLHMSERGDSCFPGQDTLATETGLSRSTIQTHLAALAEAGWLEIVRPKDQGRGQSNRYTARVPKRAQEAGPSENGRAQLSTERAHLTAEKGPGAAREDDRRSSVGRQRDSADASTSAKANGKRPRNPLFDALACAGRRVDLDHLPASRARTIGVKLAELREAEPEVTPEEITRRAARYRREHPDWALTPEALVKHWAELAPAGSVAPRGRRCSRCAVQGPLPRCSLGEAFAECPGDVIERRDHARD